MQPYQCSMHNSMVRGVQLPVHIHHILDLWKLYNAEEVCTAQKEALRCNSSDHKKTAGM